MVSKLQNLYGNTTQKLNFWEKKLKNSNCDKTQKLKWWQNSNCDNTQIGIILKLCDKTQIVTKLKTQNVREKLNLWKNSIT